MKYSFLPLFAIFSLVIYFVCPSLRAQSGTLPVMHIRTLDGEPVTSKTVYKPGTYYIDPMGDASATGFGTESSPLSLEIRGRGHSSWKGEKKPYKLKLANKLPLMGMAGNRHWALLKFYEPTISVWSWGG